LHVGSPEKGDMADARKLTDELVDALVRQGWRLREGKHRILYAPDKRIPPISFSRTPSDYRGIENKLAELRRFGVRV
jgi:hypothetical protein